MKKRSAILLILLLVTAGAAGALTGFAGSLVLAGSDHAPSRSLPALVPSPGSVGRPDEASEKIALSADYHDPVVSRFVTDHSRSTGGANTIEQVSDVWDAIHSTWSYIRGPADYNLYNPAGSTIMHGLSGNCLDFAILNAAVIASLGGEARVVTAYSPLEGGHAYTEVYVGDSIAAVTPVGDYLAFRYNTTTIHWHTVAGPGGTTQYWLNLDWQAPYPGGPLFADNGTYYASFLTGSGQGYRDSGEPVPNAG